MRRIGSMSLLLGAWVTAAIVWELTGRWWLGVVRSFALTGLVYRILDPLDRRAAARESLASTATDYRLTRH